jgi:hypothetical protein
MIGIKAQKKPSLNHKNTMKTFVFTPSKVLDQRCLDTGGSVQAPRARVQRDNWRSQSPVSRFVESPPVVPGSLPSQEVWQSSHQVGEVDNSVTLPHGARTSADSHLPYQRRQQTLQALKHILLSES